MLAYLAPDVDRHSPGSPEIPWARTVRSRAQVAEWFAQREQSIICERRVPKEFVAQADQVVVMYDETSRFKRNGRQVLLSVMAVWTLMGGLVTRYRES